MFVDARAQVEITLNESWDRKSDVECDHDSDFQMWGIVFYCTTGDVNLDEIEVDIILLDDIQ